MKIKRCTVELVFDIWENELDVNEVPKVIEAGVEKWDILYIVVLMW